MESAFFLRVFRCFGCCILIQLSAKTNCPYNNTADHKTNASYEDKSQKRENINTQVKSIDKACHGLEAARIQQVIG